MTHALNRDLMAVWLLVTALAGSHTHFLHAGMADVLVVMIVMFAGTGFMPGPAAPIQGTRASARLAAAGPNPFSAAGTQPHMHACNSIA